jgi:hypothetical protein
VTAAPDCRAVHDDLAELALGTLSGFDRSVVLAHVQGCPNCLEEVRQLSAAADTVLALAPDAEPPAGFESRLFERMGVHRRRWPFATRARRVVAAVAAGAGALGLGLGIGLTTASGPTATVQPAPIVANLVADHVVKGEVYVAPGHPGWLFMSVHGLRANGVVSCRLALRGGRALTVGSFVLEGGTGSWTYELPVPASQVRGVWLVNGAGSVLASASLKA